MLTMVSWIDWYVLNIEIFFLFACFCYLPLSFLHHLPFLVKKKSIDLSERSVRNVFINMHHPNIEDIT